MKLHHSPEHVVREESIRSTKNFVPDPRKYAAYAFVDSAIEVYDAGDNNIGTIVYDPELKWELALSIVDDEEGVENPSPARWDSPEQAAQRLSTEELEYTVYAALKALQIKRQDELEKRREAKKYHEIGQKLREIWYDGIYGDQQPNVWLEIAKAAEKAFVA